MFIRKHQHLLDNIKSKMPELIRIEKLTHRYEDCIYRFYHQSYKVYSLQQITNEMVSVLRDLAPEGTKLSNEYFLQIIEDGTGKKWEPQHNLAWMENTRPILEAFFHATYMLKSAIKCGKELAQAPEILPFDWAALLYLYNIR